MAAFADEVVVPPLARALAASAGVAAIALPLGSLVPLLGAPLMALALGMLVPVRTLTVELGWTSRYALQAGIVALGATISLHEVASVGGASLPVMFGSLASALLAAFVFGRRLGVPSRLRTLIGVGTAICGASAIGAVSGVIDARPSEVRYAISTIFAFNLAAVILFPPLGHLFGLSQSAFGLWAGTAVNDASSAVAAGFAYGHAAASHAIVVKLTRTTMIIPIVLALGARGSVRRAIPWFLVWFVVAAALHSCGLALPFAGAAGRFLTTLALAAVGLGTDFGELRLAGWRPLLLGASTWVCVACVSLVLGRL